MSERRNREFWEEHIKRWKTSRLSQTVYCQENDLKSRNFSKWKIKLCSENQCIKDDFIKVELSDLSKESEIEIIIKDIFRIKVNSVYDETLFKRVVKNLEELL